MPPTKPQSEAKAAPPSSRRSARLEGKPPSAAPKAEETKPSTTTKKRSAGEAKPPSAPGSKKSKPAAPSSKPAAPSSKPAPVSAAAKEEKKAEAPKSAKPSGKELAEGDTLPKITLKDNEGKEVDVSGLAGERGVVLFLYPKADTPGCTTQACGFRDAFDEISELGYDVYGLSKDTVAAQQKWLTKKSLNYKLLSDPESKLIKRLGAFVLPNNTKRSHFIFEKGSGKLVEAKFGVKPADDPTNCLKFIKAHHK